MLLPSHSLAALERHHGCPQTQGPSEWFQLEVTVHLQKIPVTQDLSLNTEICMRKISP